MNVFVFVETICSQDGCCCMLLWFMKKVLINNFEFHCLKKLQIRDTLTVEVPQVSGVFYNSCWGLIPLRQPLTSIFHKSKYICCYSWKSFLYFLDGFASSINIKNKIGFVQLNKWEFQTNGQKLKLILLSGNLSMAWPHGLKEIRKMVNTWEGYIEIWWPLFSLTTLNSIVPSFQLEDASLVAEMPWLQLLCHNP
jgi:hypothetical protein